MSHLRGLTENPERGRIRIATLVTLAAGFLVLPAATASSEQTITKGMIGGSRQAFEAADRPANGNSGRPAISADGRFVAFSSSASDLVPGDSNDEDDVFVRDLRARTTERVSVGFGRAQATGGSSFTPTISADGQQIAFTSRATNLVAGDTNGQDDAFVRDRVAEATARVSVGDRNVEADQESFAVDISPDGRYVAFAGSSDRLTSGDTNGTWDVFLRDRTRNSTERVDLATNEAEPQIGRRTYTSAAVSTDGRFVAFVSIAPNLVAGDTNRTADVFVRDRALHTTERVSVATDGAEAQGESGLYAPSITPDGRFVAFASLAPNLVPGDTNGTWDIFLHDRATGTTERESLSSGGTQGNGPSISRPALSADGRFVAFESSASNLVSGDENGTLTSSFGIVSRRPRNVSA